jgi:nicotinamidase-related amidase
MSGYIEAFTWPVAIDPADTALVVVDMQYASGSREHGLGAHLARQGKLGDAAYRFDRIDNVVIPNTQRLLAAWRAAGAPVIYVTLGARNADYSDAPGYLRDFFETCHNHQGTRENDVVDALKPMPGEPVLLKNTMGAFASTPLADLFDRLGVKTAVYVGVSTNNCVDTTAREASDRGYASIIVSDATGTCSEAMQQSALASFQRLSGRVVSTDEAIRELAHPVARKAA